MLYTITLNPAIDKIIKIEDTLEREKNNKIKNIVYDIGGKGCHVSGVFSAMGIPSIATGFTAGENGEKLINLMEKRGVNCEFINVENSNTRECIILVDESNKGSYMITESGELPDEKSFEKLISKIKKDIKKDDIVALSGSPATNFPREKYREIIKVLKETKSKLFIDARDKYLEVAVSMSPFFIKPNKHEFQILTGKHLESLDDYINEIKKIMEKIDVVVVSLGEKGSIAGVKGEGIYNFIPPKVSVLSETGCGDAFVGGFISQLYFGENIINSLKFATAVSASKAEHFLSSDFSISQAVEFLSNVKVVKYE